MYPRWIVFWFEEDDSDHDVALNELLKKDWKKKMQIHSW